MGPEEVDKRGKSGARGESLRNPAVGCRMKQKEERVSEECGTAREGAGDVSIR